MKYITLTANDLRTGMRLGKRVPIRYTGERREKTAEIDHVETSYDFYPKVIRDDNKLQEGNGNRASQDIADRVTKGSG